MDKKIIKIEYLRFRAGSISREQFFEKLWHSQGKKISFYVNRLVISEKNHHDDLFQEIMLKVFNNLDSYNPLYSFDTWIYKIARHHCIDFLKKKNLTDPECTTDDFLSSEATPENEYLTKEMVGEVEAAMSILSNYEKELD